MKTIEKICPECGNRMEYWARGNTITCPKCKTLLVVKNCKEEIKENEILEILKESPEGESICSSCTYHEEYEDEIDGDLYDDGCVCTNEKAQKPINYHLKNCYSNSNDCPYFKSKEIKVIRVDV